MRKNFIEKYRFYKFLEDLCNTPDSATSPVYYYKMVDEIELSIIDVYCYFIRDRKNTSFLACFFFKPKEIRISSQSLPICQILLQESEITKAVFVDSVQTLSDFLHYQFFDCEIYNNNFYKVIQDYEIANR